MLFICGVFLLTGGLLSLSAAQLNQPPEAAYAQPPQPAISLPFVGAQPAISEAPENNDIPYDDTLQRNSVGNLFRFIEGAFGALIMTAAGIGAIVAASMGAYKAAVGILVVAVGAFILRALVSLFFGTDYVSYDVGNL